MNPRQDVERAIVGTVITHGGSALQILSGDLSVGEFSSVRCRAWFGSALRLHARGLPIDPVSLKADLESRGELEAAGGLAFLIALTDAPAVNGNLRGHVAVLRELPEPGAADLPDLGEDANRTDVGAARALVTLHGRDLRHVHGQGWRVWNGKVWASDATADVMTRAKGTAEALLHAAIDVGDKTTRAAAVKWALGCHSEARLGAMVNLAASEPGIAVARDTFDRDPMLFNTETGTIELKVGELRLHRRSDMITKLAPVPFDPDATCPIFDAFLKRIFDGNQRVIDFVQRVAGYALTGDTSEQVIIMLYGSGANGKSTLVRTLLHLWGDYGRQARSEVVLLRHRDEQDNEIARLCGSRLVTLIEVEEGRRLAEGLVKQISGGDRVAARQKYEKAFEFDPTFKIMIAVNHRPVIRGTDLAIWRRIRLVPFNVSIPAEEQDRKLADKLRAELPGILHWAINGCLAWQRDGLREPPEVMGATDTYRRDMDVIGAFIDQECVQVEGASVGKGALYKTYREWCQGNGEDALRQQDFGRRLLERGIRDSRTGTKGRFWVGIGLTSDRDE